LQASGLILNLARTLPVDASASVNIKRKNANPFSKLHCVMVPQKTDPPNGAIY